MFVFFLCVVVAVVIANLCFGFHVNLFNVCEKIARPHTRTRSGTHAHIKCGTPTHLRMVQNARLLAHIFFSVCCYEKSGVLHNIMHSFFIGLSSFFLYFFLTNVENGREKLGKNQQAFLRTFFLESVTKSSN